MTDSPISHEIALRIGLAARMLPDCEPRTLLGILAETVGLPPTEESLGNLTVKQLRTASDGALGGAPADALKGALACLKGETGALEPLPTPESYSEGEMADSIRVACASNHGEELDGHFGSCNHFLIYQVSRDALRLIDVRRVGQPPEDMEKNAHRAQLIGDCHILFVASIGGPAAAKVVKAGVHPIKHPEGGPARARLAGLQQVLAGDPPPWLAKVMGQDAEQRVRFERTAEEV